MLSDIYKKVSFKIFRLSLWQLLIPIIFGIIIALISYPKGFLLARFIPFLVIYSLSMGIPFMKIYEYTEWKLEQHIPWLLKPNLRFFISVFLELAIGILILILVNWVMIVLVQKQGIDILFSKTTEGLKYLIIFTFAGITLINSFHFFKNWKQAAVNEEKLKREKLSI